MPQLDISNFFSESFLFIFFFSIFYALSLIGIIPNFFSIFLIRKFYLNALVQNFLENQLAYFQIMRWSYFITFIWFAQFRSQCQKNISDVIYYKTSSVILAVNLLINRFIYFQLSNCFYIIN